MKVWVVERAFQGHSFFEAKKSNLPYSTVSYFQRISQSTGQDQRKNEHSGVLRGLVLLVQFKNREKTHEGVLLLVKLQAAACNFA